ncbi:recombinase family protein [Pantoea agglomerans]|uniref:recombinase family protein n=1 Tax=Enterobacter agglomerans TaxID=549 RepID=UPI00315A60B2
MRKCFLYCRISSDAQSTGDGLDRQEARLLTYVQNMGHSLGLDCNNTEMIVDSGKSAFKGHHLHDTSGLGKLFSKVEAGLIDGTALICESLDRFSRQNPFKVMKYLSLLAEHNIELHDVEQNLVISPKNKMSLTLATIIASRSNEESTIKSKRIKSGWSKRREKAKSFGHYMIKNTPPWISIIDDKYVLNDKAVLVREIFELYLNGLGSYTIGKTLNEQNKYLTDVKWTTAKVCKVLRNVRCKGDYLSNSLERDFENDTEEVNKFVFKNLYPAVVSEQEFEQVRRKLQQHNFVGRVRDNKKQTVFGGFLKCGLCGSALPVKVNGKYRYAKCLAAIEQHGCQAVNHNYTVLEKAILKHVQQVDFERVYRKSEVTELDSLRSEIVEVKKNIEEYSIGIERVKSAGRTPGFDMLDLKAQSEEKLSVLNDRLASLEDAGNVSNITLSDSIHEIENVVERSRLEVELRKVIDSILVIKGDGVTFLSLTYHNDIIKHMIMINKDGTILSNGSLSSDLVLDLDFASLNIQSGEVVYRREVTSKDLEIVNQWSAYLQKQFEIAAKMV